MFSCAGVCSYEGRSGMCSIRLSFPLLKLRPRKDLVETLLHEMIHAFLFVTRNNRDRDGHGPDFQYHMCRINQMANTNITIYHSFYDEVATYKQHIWRCDGPCRKRSPYFGYVKRSSNRAPGPNDLWWNSHKSSCNGLFQKIREPKGYGQRKRRKVEQNVVPGNKNAAGNTLDKYFSNAAIGRGQICGSGNKAVDPSDFSEKTGLSTSFVSKDNKVPGESSCLNNTTGSGTSRKSDVEVIEIELDLKRSKVNGLSPPLSFIGSSEHPIEIDDDKNPRLPTIDFVSPKETTDGITFDRFVCCPSCDERIIECFINDHLDICISS